MANETKFPNGVDLEGQDLVNRGNPEVKVDGDPATLNFVPNGDGTYRMVVTV